METEKKRIFIEVTTFVSKYKINFRKLEDFENFIKEKNIEFIYYSSQKCFFVVFESLLYSFTYDLEEGYYETIEDYKDGNSRGFKSSIIYYNAVKNGFKDQDEENYYQNSLFLSIKDYKDALKYNFIKNRAEGKYSVPIVGLITKGDFLKNIYYINVAFSIYLDRGFLNQNGKLEISISEDENADDIVKKFKKPDIKSFYNVGFDYNKMEIINEFNEYYFIYLDINLPTAYGKYEKEDAAFFYYSKFAQYDYLNDFLESRTKSNETFNLSNSGFYIMKNTSNILKEMNKNKGDYIKFFESKEFELLTSLIPDPRYIYPKKN